MDESLSASAWLVRDTDRVSVTMMYTYCSKPKPKPKQNDTYLPPYPEGRIASASLCSGLPAHESRFISLSLKIESK